MGKIELTPTELLSQSNELSSLAERYESLFSNVSSILNNVNTGWSEVLSNNFEGKINSAQKNFSGIVNALSQGANVASTSANSFENVDSLLAKNINGNNNPFGFGYGENFNSNLYDGTSLKDEVKDQIKESWNTSQEFATFVKENYEKLPKWMRKAIQKIWDEKYGEDLWGSAELFFDVLSQDGKGWLTLDIDSGIVKDFAKLIGVGKPEAYVLAEAYKQSLHPEGIYGEIRSGEDLFKNLAYEAFDKGEYGEGLKNFATMLGIDVYALFYGVYEVGTEATANWIESEGELVVSALDTMTKITPNVIDDYTVEGVETILNTICDGIRSIF